MIECSLLTGLAGCAKWQSMIIITACAVAIVIAICIVFVVICHYCLCGCRRRRRRRRRRRHHCRFIEKASKPFTPLLDRKSSVLHQLLSNRVKRDKVGDLRGEGRKFQRRDAEKLLYQILVKRRLCT